MQSKDGVAAAPGTPRVFYVLADEGDAPRLERLLCGAGRASPAWGLSEHDRDAWGAMRPGDLVYIGLATSPTLRACCRVSRIAADPGAAGRGTGGEWAGRTRIVHFSHLRHVGVAYGELERYAGSPHEPPRTLFRVPDGWAPHVLAEWPVHGEIFGLPGAAAPLDLISPPDSVPYGVARVIRETTASRNLVKAYGGRCQVCGHSLETASGRRHSEVHHLHPLHEGGTDTPDNMVVLCARHHAEFDFGVLCVDTSGRAVGRGDSNGAALHFEPGHRLAPENVMYGMLKLNSVGS